MNNKFYTKKDVKTELENDLITSLISIYDSLKILDNEHKIDHFGETSSEIFFRKLKANNIDLNKLLDVDYLKPISTKK